MHCTINTTNNIFVVCLAVVIDPFGCDFTSSFKFPDITFFGATVQPDRPKTKFELNRETFETETSYARKRFDHSKVEAKF